MIDPNLITTTRVGELPPFAFSLTDLIPHEVGTDLKSGTIQQLLDFLRPLVGKLQFEVVRMSVNTQYIVDNFDLVPGPNMGLGTNLCLGFAICNGNNGTENLDGRSGIGYGTVNNFVGLTGGSTTHALTVAEMPVHSHVINEVYNENNAGTKVGSGGGSIEAVGTQSTATSGSGTPHNIQDPYIVQLYMMKL